MANIKNLANGIVLTPPTGTTGTSMVLESGYGGIMPAVPFYLTCTPPGQLSTMGNSEIVKVTARTTDTLTIERGQRETTAKTMSAGWIVANGLYAEDIIGGTNGIVVKETPSGTKDGVNNTFSTASTYMAGSLQVFINGLAQSGMTVETSPLSGGFSITPAPTAADDISVSYMTTGAGSGNADTVDGIHASSTPAPNSLLALGSNSKFGANAVDIPIVVTNIYTNFYIQPNVTGTVGNSYTFTVNLPRPLEAGESIMLYPIAARWGVVDLTSNTSTQFTFNLHCLVNTSIMYSRWSAIYYKSNV